jgi:hypothetical protein
MKELYGCFSLLGMMFCVVVILSVWGCIPDSTDVNYGPSDEYRMRDVERKLEMLERNENY